MWMARTSVTDDVRSALCTSSPSNEQHVIGFNPLLADTPAHGYYSTRYGDYPPRVESVEHRGDASSRLLDFGMLLFFGRPRNFGLTIADCVHFLLPGSSSPRAALRLPARPASVRGQELGSRAKGLRWFGFSNHRNRLAVLRERYPAPHVRFRPRIGSTSSGLCEGKIIILNLSRPRTGFDTACRRAIERWC